MLELDFKDIATVPPEQEGKRQHVVEVLTVVDEGTSLLLSATVREDVTAQTTLASLIEHFRTHGLPQRVVFDRDPRFVGGQHGADFPAPCIRMLLCLGVEVSICPPRRPDKKA